MAALQSLLKGPAEGGTVRVPLSATYREWNWSSCGTGTDVLWQWQRWHLELLLTWTRSWILWEIRFWDPLVGNGAMSRTTLERPLSAAHNHSSQARSLVSSEPMRKRAHAPSPAHPLLIQSIHVMRRIGSSQTSAYIESYELGLYWCQLWCLRS